MSRQSSFASDTEEAEMSHERRAEIEAVARALSHQAQEDPNVMWRNWTSEATVAIRALDRLRDARGDDEAGPDEPCPTCNGEGRIDLNANWHGPPGVERHHWHPCPDCDGSGSRSPQGEDHEAGIEAMARVIHPRFDEYAAHGQARWLDEARDALAAYLARVSAPKADEKAPSEQNADGG